jgi:hypothetical protein
LEDFAKGLTRASSSPNVSTASDSVTSNGSSPINALRLIDVDVILSIRSWRVATAALVALTSDNAQDTALGAFRTSATIVLRIELSLPDIASRPVIDAATLKGSITDEN